MAATPLHKVALMQSGIVDHHATIEYTVLLASLMSHCAAVVLVEH